MLESVSNKVVKFVKFLRILRNICERLLLHFHYNSHHHYFHYYCKMHLYRLRIRLTIPLDCNIYLCLFQLNFVFFLPIYIFSLILFQTFHFLRPVSGLRIFLRPLDKFEMFFLYLCLYL